MDITELPEKQRRLKEYMIINPNGATIKEIMLAEEREKQRIGF